MIYKQMLCETVPFLYNSVRANEAQNAKILRTLSFSFKILVLTKEISVTHQLTQKDDLANEVLYSAILLLAI